MDEHEPHRENERPREVSRAAEGAGALLQRDYWAVVSGCSLRCPEVAMLLRERFAQFAPREFVVFTPRSEGLLEVGDELEVAIRMTPKAGVRVLHIDDNSLTLGTLRGHPEAGRITFGAYRSRRGDVIVHIRSRARAGSVLHHGGFLIAGDAMQTETWTDFLDALAHTIGQGVVGAIYATTRTMVDEEDGDPSGPTYLARGE